jgi:surface antigen
MTIPFQDSGVVRSNFDRAKGRGSWFAGFVLVLSLFASGCQTLGSGPSFPFTPSKGRATGQAATGISGGGLVGGPFGQALSPDDRQAALNAEYKALEYAGGGELVVWTGKDSASGTVVAAQPYRVGSQDCRQYKHELTALGKTTSSRATACRNNDGSWTLLN